MPAISQCVASATLAVEVKVSLTVRVKGHGPRPRLLSQTLAIVLDAIISRRRCSLPPFKLTGQTNVSLPAPVESYCGWKWVTSAHHGSIYPSKRPCTHPPTLRASLSQWGLKAKCCHMADIACLMTDRWKRALSSESGYQWGGFNVHADKKRNDGSVISFLHGELYLRWYEGSKVNYCPPRPMFSSMMYIELWWVTWFPKKKANERGDVIVAMTSPLLDLVMHL